MNLSELCIRRPVMTTLLMAAIMIFGIVGYRQLPISALPKVDFPTIVIIASLDGAKLTFPELESKVANPTDAPSGLDVPGNARVTPPKAPTPKLPPGQLPFGLESPPEAK